jgi:hypothetical protein
VLDEGYEYDAVGSVSKRSQFWSSSGLFESFTYDSLNRLSTSQVQTGFSGT